MGLGRRSLLEGAADWAAGSRLRDCGSSPTACHSSSQKLAAAAAAAARLLLLPTVPKWPWPCHACEPRMPLTRSWRTLTRHSSLITMFLSLHISRAQQRLRHRPKLPRLLLPRHQMRSSPHPQKTNSSEPSMKRWRSTMLILGRQTCDPEPKHHLCARLFLPTRVLLGRLEKSTVALTKEISQLEVTCHNNPSRPIKPPRTFNIPVLFSAGFIARKAGGMPSPASSVAARRPLHVAM
jgi:hypothetical protein